MKIGWTETRPDYSWVALALGKIRAEMDRSWITGPGQNWG